MKKFKIILFLFLFATVLYAQDHFFILVDVSKSVRQSELNDAKQAINEILTGAPLSKAFIAHGSQQDLALFRIKAGDKIGIARFGSLSTTLAINPQLTTIQNIDADLSTAINSISWTPTDNQTYLTLAKAKISEFAKRNNISRYRLCLISDNVNDDFGPNGLPNYPDDYTRNLVESYNTSTNPIREAGFTRLKFDKTSLFTISFSPSVDITGYTLPGGTTTTIVDNPAISINSPKGTKNSPVLLKSETLNLNWTCSHCPEGIRYSVRISQEGGKFRENKTNLTSNRLSINLPNGQFSITVSSSNVTGVSSDTTFISVNEGGYGWLLVLSTLLAGAGGGYYFWDKKRREKIENVFENQPDIFDTNTRPINNTTHNSEYF